MHAGDHHHLAHAAPGAMTSVPLAAQMMPGVGLPHAYALPMQFGVLPPMDPMVLQQPQPLASFAPTIEMSADNGCQKKTRLVWTPELHKRFLFAVERIGLKVAVPRTILQARAGMGGVVSAWSRAAVSHGASAAALHGC